MTARKAEFKHNYTATSLRNAAQKQEFRNALTRFVITCSLSHNSVVSKEFQELILIVNPEADYVLLRLSSSLVSRIV
jgi:hypothetical protein